MEINRDIIFTDYKPLVITEETRQYVLAHPERHLNCPVRIRMGKFYTDKEYEKYVSRSLKRKLPGTPKRYSLKRKEKIRIS